MVLHLYDHSGACWRMRRQAEGPRRREGHTSPEVFSGRRWSPSVLLRRRHRWGPAGPLGTASAHSSWCVLSLLAPCAVLLQRRRGSSWGGRDQSPPLALQGAEEERGLRRLVSAPGEPASCFATGAAPGWLWVLLAPVGRLFSARRRLHATRAGEPDSSDAFAIWARWGSAHDQAIASWAEYEQNAIAPGTCGRSFTGRRKVLEEGGGSLSERRVGRGPWSGGSCCDTSWAGRTKKHSVEALKALGG